MQIGKYMNKYENACDSFAPLCMYEIQPPPSSNAEILYTIPLLALGLGSLCILHSKSQNPLTTNKQTKQPPLLLQLLSALHTGQVSGSQILEAADKAPTFVDRIGVLYKLLVTFLHYPNGGWPKHTLDAKKRRAIKNESLPNRSTQQQQK